MRSSRTELVVAVLLAVVVIGGLGSWFKHDLEDDGIGPRLSGLVGASEADLVRAIGAPVERLPYARLKAKAFRVWDSYSKAQDVPCDECLVYRGKFYAYVVYLRSGRVVGSCRIAT